MAPPRNNNEPKIAGNSPETRPVSGDAPLIVDTTKQPGVEPDPRGDNRPGVYADPLMEGVDPVTNLYTSEVDPVTGTPGMPTVGEPLNQPILPQAEDVSTGGRKVKMVAERDYWPRTQPKDWPADRDYRIRAGDEFEVSQAEAEDLMEQGIAKRAKR